MSNQILSSLIALLIATFPAALLAEQKAAPPQRVTLYIATTDVAKEEINYLSGQLRRLHDVALPAAEIISIPLRDAHLFASDIKASFFDIALCDTAYCDQLLSAGYQPVGFSGTSGVTAFSLAKKGRSVKGAAVESRLDSAHLAAAQRDFPGAASWANQASVHKLIDDLVSGKADVAVTSNSEFLALAESNRWQFKVVGNGKPISRFQLVARKPGDPVIGLVMDAINRAPVKIIDGSLSQAPGEVVTTRNTDGVIPVAKR